MARTYTRRVLRRLRKAALGLLVAFAILGGVELALRASKGPPPPPVEVYSEALGRWDSYLSCDQWSCKPNWLHPPKQIAKESKKPRVVIVGGSSVRGGTPGLPPEGEFSSILQQRLPAAEVVNLGKPGFDSHDLLALVDELGQIQVDVLVVYTGHNDFGNTYFKQRYSDWSGGARARTRAFLGRFQLYTALRERLGTVAIDGEAVAGNSMHGPQVDAGRKGAAQEHLLQNLERIAWISGQRGTTLALVPPVSAVTMPPIGTDEAASALHARAQEATGDDAVELYRAARDADSVPLRCLTPAVDAMYGIEGAHIVDAEALLPRHEGLDLPARSLFIDPVHLSRSGHEAVAELLASELAPLLE